MKRYSWIFGLLAFFIFSKNGLASGFNIKSIGGVETGGTMVSKFWHTSSQPTIRGEATPGENINVTVDDQTLQIAADSSGDWVFTPQPLGDGDHSVAITGASSTMNFTLTTGRENVDWASVEKGNSETLPTVGVVWPTLVLLITCIGLLGLGTRTLISNRE